MTHQLVPFTRAAPRLSLRSEDLLQLTGNDLALAEPYSTVKIVEITLSEADLFEADCVLAECMDLFVQWTAIEEEEKVAIAAPVDHHYDNDGLVMVFETLSGTLCFDSPWTTPAIEMAPPSSMAADSTVSSESSSSLLSDLESQSSSSIDEVSAHSIIYGCYPESDVDSSSSSGNESDTDFSDSNASTVSSAHLPHRIPSDCDCCNEESDDESQSSVTGMSTVPSSAESAINCDCCNEKSDDESHSSSVTGVSPVPSSTASSIDCGCCQETQANVATSVASFITTAQPILASTPTASEDGALQPEQIRKMLAECEELIGNTLAMKMQLMKMMVENGWTKEKKE